MGDFYLFVLVGRNIFCEGDPIFPIAFMMHDRKYMKYNKEFLCEVFPIIGMENASKIPIVTDREKRLTVCFKKVFPKSPMYSAVTIY